MLISSVGLGGVLLTRFGTRDYGDPEDDEIVEDLPPAIPPTLGEDEPEAAPAELEAPADETPTEAETPADDTPDMIADPSEEPTPEAEVAEETPKADEASGAETDEE